MLIRTVLAVVLIVPFAMQLEGQAVAKATARPKTTDMLRQFWTVHATYKDARHGVSFQYPAAWHAGTIFSYCPPILSEPTFAEPNLKPVAGFGYSPPRPLRPDEAGPYSHTNLESVDIIYAAIPAKGKQDCDAKATSIVKASPDSDPHPLRSVVFGGRSFTVYNVGGQVMGKWISGKFYATYAGHTCYLFETDTAAVQDGLMEGVTSLTQAQYKAIDKHLLEIMKTVRIAR